jgi:hypothetical protein
VPVLVEPAVIVAGDMERTRLLKGPVLTVKIDVP